MGDQGNIDHATVREIAALARLKLDDSEVEAMSGALGSIISYIEQLSEVDTSEIEEHALDGSKLSSWREDQVRESLSSDMALKNAPDQETGYIKVPPIVGS